LVLASALLAGCQQATSAEETKIKTDSDFRAAVAEVATLTREPLNKVVAKQELTPEEKDSLRKAIPKIDEIIAYDPSRIHSFALKGKVGIALDDRPLAEKSLRQAIATTPQATTDEVRLVLAECHNDLASVLIFEIKYQEALEQASKATELEPRNDRYFFTLARAQLELKQVKEASESLEKALDLNPQNIDAQNLKKLVEMSGQAARP
jgi:tetratricopeptide (TPR) repeat protein